MANKLFSDLVSFSRGTGATRVNSAGLIVGVDFSATSNTIATGSKTFTLTADANVNRDWAVNSSVIAVAQAGATGSMTGTVTSYTPSTQALVINVTSVTGSGTSTDWRIGSLEMREDYDPVTLVRKGVLSEVAATNLSVGVASSAVGGAIALNALTSPDGSVNAVSFVTDATNGQHRIDKSISGSQAGNQVFSATVKPIGGQQWISLRVGAEGVAFDLINGVVGVAVVGRSGAIQNIGNGYFRCSVSAISAAANDTVRINMEPTNNTAQSYVPPSGSGFYYYGLQLEQATSATSYIPTTTAQVTRSADNFPLTAAAVTAIRQGEGTLYAEIDCPDTGVAQKRALRLSGTNADIRIGKQGTGTLSNFTKMAEGAGLRLMGTSTSLIRGNGQDMVGVTLIEERNGLVLSAIAGFGFGAVAFNGGDRFAALFVLEESFINALATTYSGRGTGVQQYNGVHHNGNRFIVACNLPGIVLLSDGNSYRRVNTPVITQATGEVTSGLVGGTLRNVIVGSNGFIATSDDNGETWTARTSGTSTMFSGVHFSNSRFVAVCAIGSQSRYSNDGITWLATTGLPSAELRDVYNNGTNLWVAVGTSGTIYSSADGITWTARTSNVTQSLNGVYFADSLWAAVGNAGTVVTSPDGVTWTDRTATSGTTGAINEVGFFNGKFYYVGNAIGVVANNSAANIVANVTWVNNNLGTTSAGNGIAASPARLLVCGNQGSIFTSEDGVTFTSRSNNAQALNGIAFGNNTFVSVGNAANGSGYIATIAADGTVTRRVSGTTGNLPSVQFLQGRFYAISTTSGQSSMSTDGVTWTVIPSLNTTSLFDIAFGNGIYLVVRGNSSNSLRRSVDGINFEAVTSPTTIVRSGVAFANGLFVIVGLNGFIETTPDGITFTQRTSGTSQFLNSVMYSTRDNLWYAAGNAGTLLYSPDAITWTAVQNSGTASILGTTLQSNQPLPQFKSGVNKIALSYKQNQVIAALNGVASSAVTTATIPTITAASIAENLNGYIKDVAIYKEALTTAEMTARTL